MPLHPPRIGALLLFMQERGSVQGSLCCRGGPGSPHITAQHRAIWCTVTPRVSLLSPLVFPTESHVGSATELNLMREPPAARAQGWPRVQEPKRSFVCEGDLDTERLIPGTKAKPKGPTNLVCHQLPVRLCRSCAVHRGQPCAQECSKSPLGLEGQRPSPESSRCSR